MSQTCNCLSRRRGNHTDVSSLSQSDMFALKVFLRFKRVRIHRAPSQRLKGPSSNELMSRLRHDDGHLRTLLHQLAAKIGRLVRSHAARNSEKNFAIVKRIGHFEEHARRIDTLPLALELVLHAG